MKRKSFVQQNFFAENDAKGNDPFASAYLFRREPKGAKGEIISLETSYLSPQIFLIMRTQQKVSPLITGQQQSLV